MERLYACGRGYLGFLFARKLFVVPTLVHHLAARTRRPVARTNTDAQRAGLVIGCDVEDATVRIRARACAAIANARLARMADHTRRAGRSLDILRLPVCQNDREAKK